MRRRRGRTSTRRRNSAEGNAVSFDGLHFSTVKGGKQSIEMVYLVRLVGHLTHTKFLILKGKKENYLYMEFRVLTPVADPGFSCWGGSSRGVCQPIFCKIFCKKLHENERI